MISVILTAYNAASTIRVAVESVLEQSWTDLELIVLDDGSTDGTREVLRRFDDPRLQIHSHSNRGPSASRNRGVSLARGEYVAWIDADDVWVKDKLEAQIKALEKSPEAAVAYGWSDFHDADGRYACPDRRATYSGNVYEPLLLHNFISNGSVTMIRRDAVEEVGGFDESLPACEDWDLHVRLAARYHFACVPAVVVQYRLSPNSLSAQLQVMEASYRRASAGLFATAPPRLRALRSDCDAAFFGYLAVRAAESGRDWRTWLAAARYAYLSVSKSPRVALALQGRLPARISAAVSRRAGIAERARRPATPVPP